MKFCKVDFTVIQNSGAEKQQFTAMPKASRQKKKARSARAGDPLAMPPSQAASEDSPALAIPVVDKLKSATSSSAERVWACAGLSNMIISGDKSTIRTLGAQKLVNALIARSDPATESDLEVRIEAVGTLRNLAVQGGAETIKEVPFSCWRSLLV